MHFVGLFSLLLSVLSWHSFEFPWGLMEATQLQCGSAVQNSSRCCVIRADRMLRMWETGQGRLHDNVWGYPLQVCSSSEQSTGTNQRTPSSRQHQPWRSFRSNCMINALSTAPHKPTLSPLSVSLYRHHVCSWWHTNHISHNDLLHKVHTPNSSGCQVVLMKSKAIGYNHFIMAAILICWHIFARSVTTHLFRALT